MVRLFRALLVAALCLPAAEAQVWTTLTNGPVHGFRNEDASFISPRQGWVVNSNGETWETRDGGDTWRLAHIEDAQLRTVAFTSARHGWIGALYGPRALFETVDGGTTLIDRTARIQPALEAGTGLCGLFALDEQTVFGVGQWNAPAYVVRTTDGGLTWQRQSMQGLAASLIDVYFLDARRGFAVGGTNSVNEGGRAVILATEDGGATWSRRFVSSGAGVATEWAWKISFPTPEVGYVSVEYLGGGDDGKFLKTTDGGRTWTERPIPGGRSTQAIGFRTADEGWTSGHGTVMHTTDGGATWRPAAEMDGRVNRIEFVGDTLAYAMGVRVYRLRAAPRPPAPGAGGLTLAVGPSPTFGRPLRIRYDVPDGGVRLDVTDALGRTVATLRDETTVAGPYEAAWAAEGLAPGVYAVRLRAGGQQAVRLVTVTYR